MKRGLAVAFATMPLLAACGREVGRVPLHGEGKAEATMPVTQGKPLAVWTSLDVKYTGSFGALYDVELVQEGSTVSKAQCDPFDVNVKTSSKVVNIGDQHSMSYNGKMKCELTPSRTGAATVKATLKYTQRPAALTVNDASLVLKE
jgi:hypothetical protein